MRNAKAGLAIIALIGVFTASADNSAADGAGFEICTVAASCKGGSFGSLSGEFGQVSGNPATDAAGSVYVGDSDNNRVQKFDSSGNFLRAWGKDVVQGGGTGFEICTVAANCQAGASGGLGGEFSGIGSVATDTAGNLYVAEFGHHRIQKFDSSGNFLRAWGIDVESGGGAGFEICTAAANCQAGTWGGFTPGGTIRAPTGMAIDTTDNVYVVDYLDHRIQKFDSSGNFLRAWGKDVVRVNEDFGFEICTVAANCKEGLGYGELGGEFYAATGIATDASGNVYLADGYSIRIQKFDSSGNFLRAWGKDVVQGGGTGFEICTVAANCQAGTLGELGGESRVISVATDTAGYVYAGDIDNRLQKFDSSGNFLRAWGKDVVQAGGTGFEICTVAANCQSGTLGGLGGELNMATGIATDTAGNVYAAELGGGPPYSHRLQKFDSSGNFLRAWGKDVLDEGGTSRILTVNRSGAGAVTGTGINCGEDCAETYNDGTSVALTATPAAGSDFVMWIACDNPSGNTCTMSMNADKTVTATFTPGDTTPPTIALTSPEQDAIYGQDQAVNASYSCSDSGSPPVSCVGTVPNGGPIDTSTLGVHTFKVTAVDASPSHNSAVSAVTYTVSPCANVITGTDHADRLSGTDGADQILGLGGDDVLRGLPGKDCLDGGNGSDVMDGKIGEDAVNGGPSGDLVIGGAGNDALRGGDGTDMLSDGLGTNRYLGEGGNDVISSRQGTVEKIGCGGGDDIAYVDKRDIVSHDCEAVRFTKVPPPGVNLPDHPGTVGHAAQRAQISTSWTGTVYTDSEHPSYAWSPGFTACGTWKYRSQGRLIWDTSIGGYVNMNVTGDTDYVKIHFKEQTVGASFGSGSLQKDIRYPGFGNLPSHKKIPTYTHVEKHFFRFGSGDAGHTLRVIVTVKWMKDRAIRDKKLAEKSGLIVECVPSDIDIVS